MIRSVIKNVIVNVSIMINKLQPINHTCTTSVTIIELLGGSNLITWMRKPNGQKLMGKSPHPEKKS